MNRKTANTHRRPRRLSLSTLVFYHANVMIIDEVYGGNESVCVRTESYTATCQRNKAWKRRILILFSIFFCADWMSWYIGRVTVFLAVVTMGRASVFLFLSVSRWPIHQLNHVTCHECERLVIEIIRSDSPSQRLSDEVKIKRAADDYSRC